MKTIQEFMDWCRTNPDLKIHTLPMEQWEIVDNWRWAIGANTANEVESAATPGTIMLWLDAAVKIMDPELLTDIEHTFNEA